MRKEERAQKETYAVLPERNNEIGTNKYNKVVAVIVDSLNRFEHASSSSFNLYLEGERKRELSAYRSSQRNPTALLREARRIAIILD